MLKHVLVALSLIIVLSACGKGDETKAQSSAVATPAGPNVSQYPNQYFAPITSEYGGFSVSYRFKQNGCSTGTREFFGYTEAEVRQELCYVLQVNRYNRYCAVDIRQAYFNTMCPGKTWNPQNPQF